MKRIVKILGYAIGGITILAALGAAFIYVKGVPYYKPDIPPSLQALNVPRDSAHVARGAKIATLLCNECHKDPETGLLSGRIMADLPRNLGKVASLNITHDADHGIGKWTDGELYYFLRTGIHADGRYSPPFMPKFPLLADDDLYSIIAWLRSDDPSLAPSSEEYPPNQWNMLVKFLANVAISPLPLPSQPIVVPDTADHLAFGRYVADGLCACYSCHSADFTKQNNLEPTQSLGYYGGGNPMLNLQGETVYTANITPDKETGIGNLTYTQFYEAVKNGKNPKGGPLYYPMFPHTTLTDTEVAAIWTFLQTVPPIYNKVQRYTPQETKVTAVQKH